MLTPSDAVVILCLGGAAFALGRLSAASHPRPEAPKPSVDPATQPHLYNMHLRGEDHPTAPDKACLRINVDGGPPRWVSPKLTIHRKDDIPEIEKSDFRTVAAAAAADPEVLLQKYHSSLELDAVEPAQGT